MEYFDIVDENGSPTGEITDRKTAHEKGLRHRTAHIWVVREREGRNEVLLQRRAAGKDSFPGRYDTSSAGHIRAGDEPLSSAVRELAEELGITASPDRLIPIGSFTNRYEKEFYGKPFRDNEVAFVFLYREPVDISSLVLQTEEVDAVGWFDLAGLYTEKLAHNKRFCVPMQDVRLLMRYLGVGEKDSTLP